MNNKQTINPSNLSKALGAWLGMQIAEEKWNIEAWDYDSGIIVLKEDRPSIYKKTVSHEEFYGEDDDV